jgi:hypothetical protein
MQNLKVFLAVGAVGLAAAVAVACSSSSNPGTNNTPDAGGEDVVDDSPVSCNPLSAANLCPTGSGETCCVSGLAGTCIPVAECTQNIQVQCTSAAQCGASQACCANIGGSTIAALLDGGFDAAAFDAAALTSEAGAAAGAGLLAGLVFKVNCEATCADNEIQACASDAKCKNGGKCVPLTDLFDGGGIDAGALTSIIASAGMNKACLSADGGLPGLPGTGDSGSDASSDAETTPDAPVADAGTDAAKEASP